MKTANRVMTGVIRLAYVHVAEPQAFENQEPKYSVTLLIPKTDKETLKRIKAAETWVRNSDKGKQNLKNAKGDVTVLRDGDEREDENEAFKGHYYFTCRSKDKPVVVDRNKDEILDLRELYSGCYARVSMDFFSYNTAGNKGISTFLRAIQKVKDGEPMGGYSPVNVATEFDDLDDDDDFLD